MSQQEISRRGFIGSLAAGAVIGTPQAEQGRAAVVHASFPVAEPKPSASRIRIVSTQAFSPPELDEIRNACANADVKVVRASELVNNIADAEVVFGTVDRDSAIRAKGVKWVQHFAAGVDTLPRELMDHPCVLTNMQRTYAPVIAEGAFALMLSLTRCLAQRSIPYFKQRKWGNEQDGLEDLYGKTLALVGLGGIGTETARRAYYGFGMRVMAVDPKPMPQPEFVSVLREPAWLMEMVPQADILMSAAPLTPLTRKLFNEKVFRAMRHSSYFINMSRGGLVDQEALMTALKERWIRGAGLDVTEPEPLPPEHPLWDCPNLVITPHNSTAAPIRRVRVMALVTENVRRYGLGLPLMNVVDKQRGY